MTGAISSISTRLNGLFKPDFTSDEKVIIDLVEYKPTPGVYPPHENPSVTVYDGRALQAKEDEGRAHFESHFYKKHGFVLLDHKSSVQNWDSGALPQTDGMDIGYEREAKSVTGENEIESRYLPEVEGLIRQQILPGRKVMIQQSPQLLRRGVGTANPFFGEIVHNDYGLTADDYEENSAAFAGDEYANQWRETYERDDVIGYMVVNLWRTVNMSQPLQHMPLGVLDASSVDREDTVSSGLKGFSPTGKITNQLSLRFKSDQRWYYYPRMTTEEVLVLNLFECYKGEDSTQVHNSFHTAFPEPNPVGSVEERQSCEHRVSVFFLKD